jgi:hypothetical protein
VIYLPPNLKVEKINLAFDLIVSNIDFALLKKPFYDVIHMGDLNRYDLSFATHELGLQNKVFQPTRGTVILDLCL